MRSLKYFISVGLLIAAGSAFAQKKVVDPDILPPLPEGPPKPASKADVAKFKVELKGACIISLKKNEGLATEVKIRNKGNINAVCECVSREIAKGANLEEMDVVASFYKGFDNKMKEEGDSAGIYIYEAGKLEENCRLDSNYKVGQPEPRERVINSVEVKADSKDEKKSK